MLPSKGYFRALECPYYSTSFCDRPYCHFKHSKQDSIDVENEDKKSEEVRNSSFSEESNIKTKLKPRIIEYVPKCIKPKNIDLDNSNEEKKTCTPEYVPSMVDKPIINSEELCRTNLDEEKINNSIELPNVLSTTVFEGIKILSDSNNTTESSKTEHSSSKRKDRHHSSSEHSQKSSRSSSKSSHKSKKSKKDKTPDHNYNTKSSSKSDHSNKNSNIKDALNNSKSSAGHKSLKEAVFEKVKKKLDDSIVSVPDKYLKKKDQEGSIDQLQSDLTDLFNSDMSDTEEIQQIKEKSDHVVETKTKKRIAHISSSSVFSMVNAKQISRPKSSKSLQELVANRIKIISQTNSTDLQDRKFEILKKTSLDNIDLSTPVLKSKVRVAHQPKIESSFTTKTNNSEIKSISNETIKFHLRIKTFKNGNNMPNPIRQSCLEKLYVAFTTHFTNEEAIKHAHVTEEEVHNKAKTTSIYRNLIVQSLMKAKKPPEQQSKNNPNYPSHMYGVCLYELLNKYILSQEELEQNGYPLMGNNNLAYISKNAHYYKPLSKKQKENKFFCMNCGNEFEVNKTGMPLLTLNKCIYHPGKLRYERSKNEKFWMCCYKRQHESGCESSIYHMPDKFNDDALEEFVLTRNIKSKKKNNEPNFFALDCEMVNTTFGTEIVRVTVIDHEGREAYESKVKPFNPVLDYKSKYSGITEESLKNCTKRLFEVQLDLLKIFDQNSILIGHSLENDLKVLKIVHYNVVDTSIMYPHKFGPPYKCSLKLLAEQHLQRIIQSEEGHDSKEDAVASLDLVWKQLKEDVKKFKPVNIISVDKK